MAEGILGGILGEEAEGKLKDANQRGPHWADPLKAWAMCS